MSFQQGLCRFVLVLCFALLPAAGPVRAQMLTGYDEPAPFVPPQENDYSYRPTLLVAPDDADEQPSAQAAPAATFSHRPPPMLTAPAAEEDTDGSAAGDVPAAARGESAVAGYDSAAPVDMTADKLEHDDKTNTVTASGNVVLVQAGRTLQAQRVTYNLATGEVTAHGGVVLTDANGDVHYAEDVALNNEMATGFVDGLRSYLADGGEFRARRGERVSSTLLTMHEASYTPCDCDRDDEGNPAWRIRAEKVTYNEEEHKISYKNPRFEIFGTPVLWLPYVAHSDGKIKRQSGLLPPDMGYDSELGLIVAQNYYWDIAPNRDATAGVMLTTSEAPVGLAQYRHRWAHGALQVDGSITRSGRTDSIAGQDVAAEEEWRGHLFADGQWDINNKWRAGVDIEATSDDQYLRQYDFSNEDVLESRIYAERFSGRDYASVHAMAFQDVRVREERTDQPNVLPEAVMGFMGEPGGMLGGRWEVNASALSLIRDGSGQDMTRGVLEAGWQRRDTTAGGLVNTIDLSLRADAYNVSDRDVATPASGRSSGGSETRLFPQAHMVTSYPLVSPRERVQLLVEPIVALTLAPNVNAEDSSIPNEDSQDVQIDATTLLEANRFPGFDRIEDRSRVTYGVRGGVFGYGGSHLTAFAGQSYNFDEDDNPFPDGSGLSRQESDVVGSLSGQYADRFGFNYRFQLDSDGLSSQRHEFDGYAHWRRFSMGSRYLFAKGLSGTSIDESREQVEGNLAYYMTEAWRTRLGALYDLGEDPGLRKAVMGVDYFGCCLMLSGTMERNLTTDSSGDSGTEVMFRVGLKGLGQFQTARDGQWGGQNAPAEWQ